MQDLGDDFETALVLPGQPFAALPELVVRNNITAEKVMRQRVVSVCCF